MTIAISHYDVKTEVKDNGDAGIEVTHHFHRAPPPPLNMAALEDIRNRTFQALGLSADVLQGPSTLPTSLEEKIKQEIREREEYTQSLLQRVAKLIHDTRHRKTRGRYLHRHKGRPQRGHHHRFQN